MVMELENPENWERFVEKNGGNWARISFGHLLPPNFVENYKDKLDWVNGSFVRRLNEEQIEKFQKELDGRKSQTLMF